MKVNVIIVCIISFARASFAWTIYLPTTQIQYGKYSKRIKLSRRKVLLVELYSHSNNISPATTQPSSPNAPRNDDDPASSPSQLPALCFYNSKTRRKEEFVPQDRSSRHVSLYTCGPTVYDSAHVGNFRAFLTYDVLKRVLLYLGYTVTHVCNITDIDDKIIVRANERQFSHVSQLTRPVEHDFVSDLAALNVLPATHYPRATEHVPEMVQLVRDLVRQGLAYETSDGSWYFRTQQHAGYGQQLVQLDYQQPRQQQELPALETVDSEKEHWADFCLWKAFKEGVDRLDAAWEDLSVEPPIQLGRPGWHLECSAMALKYFPSQTLDLHGGGVDLQFPHHENEIAQAEGATGRPFCQCWIHNGFVNINDTKMSKSLGNFLTLQTACPTPDDVRAYRYLVVSSQYRNPLALTTAATRAAKNALKRLDRVRRQLRDVLDATKGAETTAKDDSTSDLATQAESALRQFEIAIRDDLSMPRAAAALFAVVKAAETEFKRASVFTNDNTLDQNDNDSNDYSSLDLVGLSKVWTVLTEMDRVFGIFYTVQNETTTPSNDEIPRPVLDLVAKRKHAKQEKNWQLADSLRAQITQLGFVVKDSKNGEPIVSRVE